RHRVMPRLYRAAVALGLVSAATFLTLSTLRPELLVSGWVYPASVAILFTLAAVSFPIKIVALLDTRRRAASPLVNQQTTVLLLGIGLGLGGWLLFMLAPLSQLYRGPLDPQWGSALVLLYPLAIAYATVRYRLFDATVVIRRSVVYAALAGLITAAYALAIAGANLLLAQANLAESAWFSAAFMFAVALAFNPLRERLRRLVDRTFFRERYDYARTIGALARSMSSLLDLGEIERRLTTTIESAMHVAHARLEVRAPARAEPAHPHQPLQVRAPARARSHRGVAGSAVSRQAGDRRERALRRHQRLHPAVLAPRPRRTRRARAALLRRFPRRDRQAR